jgi:hypothetical protein
MTNTPNRKRKDDRTTKADSERDEETDEERWQNSARVRDVNEGHDADALQEASERMLLRNDRL